MKVIGASNHTDKQRAPNDFYSTEPKATELLLEFEKFNRQIWEPACGDGAMSKVLEARGHNVISSDIVYRGYGIKDSIDFLKRDAPPDGFGGDIITNPPYSCAEEFVRKALELISPGAKASMFLRLLFLESKKRKKLFERYPFKTLYVSSSRLKCFHNGDTESPAEAMIAFGWFVWEKGYRGDSIIKWIN
jgi:hypothetical protein